MGLGTPENNVTFFDKKSRIMDWHLGLVTNGSAVETRLFQRLKIVIFGIFSNPNLVNCQSICDITLRNFYVKVKKFLQMISKMTEAEDGDT